MTYADRAHIQPELTSLTPVLVVDDSKAQRRLLTRTLEKWGFKTFEAASGEEALILCEAVPFDIVISDWLMSGMSGVDFCRAFREMSDHPAFFVLMTAQQERERLAEGLESGADDFLSKPFHSVELRARLRAGQRIVQSQKALTEKNLALAKTLEDLSDAYAAIDRDLRGARKFQEALIPKRSAIFGNIDVALLFQSSGHVGGDLVGYFPIQDGELVVFSVDVSGHGVASALMTARIAGYFSATAPDRNIALRKTSRGFELIPLPDILDRLNEILLLDGESDQYLTMSIARIETEGGLINLCQAGHPSPAIQRKDGNVEFIDLWSTPIGLVEDPEFASTTLRLSSGERLLLYSDGLTECPDDQDRLLEEQGFSEIIKRLGQTNGTGFIDGLLATLIGYRGNRDFPDDLSAALVEMR